jgi:hypothetical protein
MPEERDQRRGRLQGRGVVQRRLAVAVDAVELGAVLEEKFNESLQVRKKSRREEKIIIIKRR